MFGSFRFVLAVMVVLSHVGGVEIIASIAVWGFFMLSGFLMTAVLNKKYGFSSQGLKRFAASRALRLMPTYWVLLICSAVAVYMLKPLGDPRLINEAFGFPENMRDVFANLFLIGQTTFGVGRIENSLSPSAWAVEVEVLMYACSAILLSRSIRVAQIALVVLAVAFCATWYFAKHLAAVGELSYASQLVYSFLPAALVPYTIGVNLWFLRAKYEKLKFSWVGLFFGASGMLIGVFIIGRITATGSYLWGLPFVALIIILLSKLNRRDHSWSVVDELLGRMSYPIYLGQWLCAYLIFALASPDDTLFFIENKRVVFNWLGFWAVLMTLLALSLVIAIFIEGPVERARHAFVAGKSVSSGKRNER